MKKQPRWMASVIETSKTEKTILPFQRGYRRVKPVRSARMRLALPRTA
ncbi:hypothetical protein K1T73_05585 [Roseovarius sp. SCSIO 43702]|nr:hypothetical protein [Roseovarius sp. SCSIO 43702]QYX57861.1 hypothetical protein K1T73_05585 [Roseovarius sp. SCSIO 43702]